MMGNPDSFHDDILINILSRIPAESVLQCRKVCKRWRNITSTPSFIDMQFKMAKPSIIAQFREDNNGRPCFFGNNEATKRKLIVSPICRYLSYLKSDNNKIKYSSHGLIVYSTSSGLSVCNPFTHEDFALPKSKGLFLCGLYFHSLTKEHRLLYLQDEDDHYGYKIFSLETNSWRDLSCISYYRPKFMLSTDGFAIPIGGTPFSGPIIVNGSLYWIAMESYESYKRSRRKSDSWENLILRFDINSEVTDIAPHPDHEKCLEQEDYYQMHLVEVEEKLGLLQMQIDWPEVIKIWILADPSKKHWVQWYKVDLDGYHKYSDGWSIDTNRVRIVGIFDGELLLHWVYKGLFRHNLQTGSIFKFEIERKKKMKIDYLDWFHSLVYKKNLVSLKR